MHIYTILKLVLFISLILSGFLISKKSSSTKYYYPFWFACIPALLVYAVVEGLRYGRGADYFTYKDAFNGIQYYELEPVFSFYTDLIVYLDAPFYFGIFFSSLFLIYSGCILTKQFRFVALFLLPLFYLETIAQSSNLVRMYFAFSFIFIGISFLINNKRVFSILFFSLAFFSHYSSFVVIPFIFLFDKFKNPFKNVYIILSLFFIANFFPISPEFIDSKLSIFNQIGYYENYLNSSEKWLLGEGLDTDVFEFGIFYKIRYYLSPVLILFLGFSILKKYEQYKLSLFYNLFFIGLLIMPTALLLPTELLYRLMLYFSSFGFVVLSFIFYDTFLNWKSSNLLKRILVLFLLIDKTYLILKLGFVLDDKSEYLFIWDNIIY